MEENWLSPLRSLLSTPWFSRVAIGIAVLYLGVFLWKILRSEEGFLFGYGNWVVGKWQSLRGIKPEEPPESSSAQVQSLSVAAGNPPASVSDLPPHDFGELTQALEAKERVLTLSRVLDGDLGYLMMSDAKDWEEQVLRGLQTIVSGVTRVMKPAGRCRCGFFILDDAQENLELVVGEGYNKSKRPKLALEPSCAGRAFLTGENYYCRDTATDPVYWHSEQGKKDFRSIACVPVRAGRAVFGVICLDAREANAFTNEDFTHLEVFAVKLAVFCAFHFLHGGGVCQIGAGEESRS